MDESFQELLEANVENYSLLSMCAGYCLGEEVRVTLVTTVASEHCFVGERRTSHLFNALYLLCSVHLNGRKKMLDTELHFDCNRVMRGILLSFTYISLIYLFHDCQ